MAIDWLGQEYGPGDLVLYSRKYSTGSEMVLAEVKEVKATTVIARILQGSRSGKRDSVTKRDLRTGKAIYYSELHEKDPAHYIHKETGERLEIGELYKRNPAYGINDTTPYYLHAASDYTHVPVTYWDYVADGPHYTVFPVTENVTKVSRDSITGIMIMTYHD